MKNLRWVLFVLIGIFALRSPALATTAFPNGVVETQWDADQSRGESFSHLDEQGGAFTYNYDLPIPAGRGGMQPNLSLQYSSNNLSEGSLVGYGWSLSIPTIERLNTSGLADIYTGTAFFSSLAGGEIVPDTVDGSGYGTYLPQAAGSGYAKFEYLSDSTWQATDVHGIVYTFGTSSDAQLSDPEDSTRIYRWYLETIEDTNGNGVLYSYTKSNNQVYPESIHYTTYEASSGTFAINFILDDRSDDAVSYSTGFQITTDQRISEIDVTVDEVLRKKFELDYVLGQNGQRSVLSTVTTTAYDENNEATTLPPLTMTPGDTASQWSDIISTGFDDRVGTKGLRFSDINGDGFTDVLGSFQTLGQVTDVREDHIYLNDHGTWTEDFTWDLPVPFTYIHSSFTSETDDDLCAQLIDVNGDGLPDEVYDNETDWYDLSNNLYENGVYINNGSGWDLSATWSLPTSLCYSNNDRGVRFVELNGDGLVDIVKAADFGAGTIKAVYMNTGSGWVEDPAWEVPVTFVAENGFENGSVLADVNADGLADIVESLYKDTDGNSQTFTETSAFVEKHVYLNTGDGWSEDTNWAIPAVGNNGDFLFARDWYSCESCSPSDYNVRFGDLNGDGLLDLIDFDSGATGLMATYGVVAYNTGSSWVVDTSPYPFQNSGCVPGNLYTDSTVIDDVNNDGIADVVVGHLPCAGYNTMSYISTGYASREAAGAYRSMQDLIANITTPSGELITISYDLAGNYLDESEESLNPRVPYPKTTMQSITYDDGLGNVATYSYVYEGGSVFYDEAHPEDRKFTGFHKIIETRPDDSTVTRFYHQNDGSDAASYEGTDSYERIGLKYREETRDSSGNVMEIVTTPWNAVTIAGDSVFVSPAGELHLVYDGDADHKDTATEYTYDETTGNLLVKTFLGQVTGSDDGTYADTGTDEIITTYTYAIDAGGVIRDALSLEEVEGHTGGAMKRTRHYYDGLTLGSVSLGNMTKQSDWISGSTYADTIYDYDDYGLVLSVQDAEGSFTYYEYDAVQPLQPTSMTNDLSQETLYEYDLATGQVTQTTDPNGGIQKTTYDGFGRPVLQEQSQPGGGATLDTVAEYVYDDDSVPNSVHETRYLDGSTSVDTYTYLDGLSRVIQVRKEAETATHYSVNDTSYDPMGHVAAISLSYDSTGTANTSITTDADLLETYTYDALGRVTSVTNAAGTTGSVYDQSMVTETDADGKVKTYAYSPRGLLIAVQENIGAFTLTTSYQYSVNQDLTKYTDSSGNVRNFTYDHLGRRLTAEDLHDPTDTEFGSWSYTFDKVGDLLTTTDANGKVVTNTYDDLHRLATENDPATGSTDVTYTYDASCANGVGRLCSVTDLNGVTTAYTYDALGRQATVAKTVDGVTKTTTNAYDRQSNTTMITQPDSSKQEFTFGTAGRISSVGWRNAAGTLSTLVTSVTYAPHGAVATIAYGNGVSSTYDYDEDDLYRLHNKLTTKSATEFEDTTYTYDAVGNITAIDDAPTIYAEVTHAMTYDDLHRLTQAAATSTDANLAATRNYTYGPLGNILTGPSGTYQYKSKDAGVFSNPHAVTKIGTTNITYDKNGNLTTDGTFTNTWDFKNRLVTAAKTGNTISYLYDYQGNRVKKTDTTSGVPTYYVDSNYEIEGIKTRHHVSAPGIGAIATITTTSTATSYVFHHTDHLGSSHVETDGAGNLLQYMVYEPYGKVRYNYQSGGYSNDYKFTGKELDPETNLTYFGARYYAAPVGRFTSEDPVFLKIGNSDSLNVLRDPQSLNSYSYARDNPINLTDPTGQFWWYGFYDNSGYEGASGIGMKLGEVFGGHQRAMREVRENQSAINQSSSANGVDPAVTRAIIVEEQSHLLPGEATAERISPNSFSGGEGLMQVREVTADNFGDYSRQDLSRNDEANISAGTAYLGTLGDNYSAYNGHGEHAELYEQRINAQLNNPDYNTNIIYDQINRAVNAVADAVSHISL